LIPIPRWLVSTRRRLFDLQIINARPTAATHQVYSSDGEVWDATLNQTDLSKNANKYVTQCPREGDAVDPPFTVTGFTCCSFCIPLATTLPACYSHVGVELERLVHHNARWDTPSRSPKPVLTLILFRAHLRLLPLFPSSRNSSDPRRQPSGRIADQ